VAAGDLRAIREVADAVDHVGGPLEDGAPDAGMQLHLCAFLVRMLARLEQHGVRRGHLAHVVQDAGQADHVEQLRRQLIRVHGALLHAPRDCLGQQLHAPHMAARVAVAKLGQVGQCHHGRFLRLAQLAKHIQVVEGGGDALAKHFQQVALDLRQRPRRRDGDGQLAVAFRMDEQHVGRMLELAALFRKRLGDGGGERMLGRHGFRLGQHGIGARGGDHLGPPGTALHQAQHAVGAHVEDGADLVQHAGSEFAQGMDLVQIGGAGEDLAQADAAALEHHQALVGTQRRDDGGKQLLRRQFRLGLVIVDVVFDDDALLGRLARLARAQHDAHDGVVQVGADALGEDQAGIIRFHHHVEQHQRDIGRVAQDVIRFAAAVGGEQLQFAALETDIAQRQPRDRMHIDIIIDDQDTPQALVGRGQPGRTGHRLIFVEQPVIICIGCEVGHEYS